MNRYFFIVALAVQATAVAQNTLRQTTFSQTARETALRSNVGDKTIAERDGQDVSLLNRNVFIHVSRTTGTWDAAWLGKTDVAIEGAGFALDWNGKVVGLESSPIEIESFTNQFGSGIEATQ